MSKFDTDLVHECYIDPPSDAILTTADDPRRCWNCGYYSFKIYGGNDVDTSGKCFVDFADNRKMRYVHGLMTCPKFQPDATVGLEEQKCS